MNLQRQSFDHLVGAGEHGRWHGDAKRLGGLEGEDQIELVRLLDWQIGRLLYVCTENLNPDVLVMEASEDGRRYNGAHVLDGTMDRGILVERSMGPQLVIVGGILG